VHKQRITAPKLIKSISNTDLAVIDFLVRNFSELLTVRQIAIKLKLSPAGVHKSLKKLEQESILKSEKLGTGLFFTINFESKPARHLCALVLLESKPSISFGEAEHIVRFCITDSKTALIVTHDTNRMNESLPKKQLDYIVMTQDEFIQKIQSKDKKVLDIILKGKVALGEEVLLNLLKRGVFRL